MAIPIPGKYGLIVLRSPRTQRYIDKRINHWNRAYPGAKEFLQDQHIAGFPEAMSYPDLMHSCEELEKKGLLEGVDFVRTHVDDGVLGPMPGWLQEDVEGTFSMPGTGKEPRKTPRPTPEEREAARLQVLADNKAAAMRERNLQSSEAADRWWPELDEAGTQRLLDDAASLVDFVERCRLGGPARSWVEREFQSKRWHIHVIDGYDKELQTAMDWFFESDCTGKATEGAQALMAVRRRAGEYVAALERATSSNAVDLQCWRAWQAAKEAGEC